MATDVFNNGGYWQLMSKGWQMCIYLSVWSSKIVKHMPGICCRNIQHSGGTHIVVALVDVIAVIADVAIVALVADVAIIALVAIVALVAVIAVIDVIADVAIVHHGLLWFVAVLSPCHCLGSWVCHGGWRVLCQ